MELTAFAFEIKDGVAHVTMNQADRGNPLDSRFAKEFNWLATECTVCPEVRSVLIDAAGRFFSVGGDLNALTRSREELARFVSVATSDLHMGISRFARMNAPVVAAVHGMAAGGAVALVAGADFALASPNAKFYAAFSGIGIISDSGGSYFLPRRMGSRRAAQFLMLNETLTAEQAADAGLINRVVAADALADEALALARRLAEGPTLAYGEAKNLLLSSPIESLEAQLENEARAMARVTATDDAWNAMRAVLAKQKPTFDGR
ncbi:MAG: enoyl-CoA hydratase/isomerase family protein [Roseiarcus sp.]